MLFAHNILVNVADVSNVMNSVCQFRCLNKHFFSCHFTQVSEKVLLDKLALLWKPQY